MIVALALIVVIFQVHTGGILLKPLNVTNIFQQNGYILILAIGMVIVIISGHIDLSVGSVAALRRRHRGSPDGQPRLAVAGRRSCSALVLGAAIGAAQGYFIAYLGIPSFIVTLAGMLVFRGGTSVVTQSTSIGPLPDNFREISTRLPAERRPEHRTAQPHAAASVCWPP